MNKFLIVIIIILALIIITGYFALQLLGNFRTSSSSPSPTPVVTQAGVKTYTSQALGVEFVYNPQQPNGGPQVNVKETGNKIYVYMANTQPETGQSIEVFNKNTNESLEASVRRQIFAQYPSKDCKVEVSQSNIQGGYQVAEISYPKPTATDEPWFVNANMCNVKYDQTNGMRYFLYDPKHPTKFAFLDIGQYAIFGAGEIAWQYSVTFLNGQ